MRRKIFIAVNLDDKTKKHIEAKLERWKQELPLKWIDAQNYHLTLAFLGYIDDENLEDLAMRLTEQLKGMEIFDIAFDQIVWGPKPEKPKMLWLRGQQDDQLIQLKHQVECALDDYDLEKKQFRPHISLARISRGRLNKSTLPEINEKTNILVPVSSIEIMESLNENGKQKYYVMESIDLE